MEKNKKRDAADVGERISDTKKEIAQLSEELEKLIKSNAGISNINFERGYSYSDSGDTKKPSETKDKAISDRVLAQNIQSSNKKANASCKILNLPDAKPKLKSESLCKKKDMSHNKEETREFMRQQKEKREEQRKKTNSKNKIDQELKKQKLLELRQKSLALVQRNIQLKRERSNSRERKQQLRIDKSNILFNSGNSPKISSNNSTPMIKAAPEVTKKIIKLQDKSVMKLGKTNERKTQIKQADKNIDQKPKTLNNYRSSTLDSQKVPINIVQKKDLSKTEEDLAARKIQAYYRGYKIRKQLELRGSQLKKNEKRNPIKESKETQTFTTEQINFPRWLQPPPVEPYPCNFINTIKKKLQLVVNSPIRCKDVGVQSSIMGTKPSYENSQNLLKEIPRVDEKIDSLSQKAQNLDAGALQHFALTQFRNKYSQINKGQSKSDSESDTSKNIPEISTESGLASEENFIFALGGSDRVPLINTDKIKDLTLKKQIVGDISDVHKNISKKSYTFNFSEEQTTDITSEKLKSKENSSKSYIRSPRDSIISFNISNDSQSPSILSQKGVPGTNSNNEIKTDKTIISERESSRRRLEFSSKESLVQKRDFYDNDNDCSDLKTISNRVTKSLKTCPVPQISRESSHLLSGGNSKNSIKTSNSLKNEDDLKISDIESRLSSFENISKTSNERSDTHDGRSEVIKSSSTIGTTSLKDSNPSNVIVSSQAKIKNLKSQPDEKLNSLTSCHSKESVSVDKSITDVSEDAEKLSSEVILEEYIEESHNNMKNSESEKSFISNSQKMNENVVNSQVVKDVKSKIVQSKSDTNEIHLKFEAEVHLLNDFNESLKQFMAVEKAFESLKNKNESSFRNASKTSSALTFSGDSKISTDLKKNISSTINTSRGSDFDESFVVDDSLLNTHLKSSNNLELSSMQRSTFDNGTFSANENFPNNLAGLSIKMFEQFIKDEDIRIENLKTIIKIREQALLDRTKGELAWLEIQRKHLKETGKLHEASLVKKKQRGILLKHQQERREMQRLKQLQKIQSNERKTILKEQKNLIKAKLTSEKLLSEMRIQTPRKQRPSGPMKVLKARESHSETLSRRGSEAEEIFSITSRSMSIKLSEVDSSRELVLKEEEVDVKSIGDTEDIDRMRKALLVRQASLMKRREAVKDLLRRHQKLLEEEKKIKELEVAANAIIMQLPYTPSKTTREPNVKSHLKDINTKEIALRDTKSLQEKCLKPTLRENLSKENDESRISMKNVSISDYSFNTFYENAKATINKMKIKQHQKEETENSSSCVEKGSSIDYSEDFESEKQVFETESTENNLSSISELIEDFTQIEYGISMGSKQFNEIPTDTSNVEKVSESTKDIKQSLNVSSWPTAESIVPHENSGSVPINTEKMEGETATLDSIKEISISQENHISTSKSEETDYSSKQILSTKRSGETIYSKLSGYSGKVPEGNAAENINSSSNELLPSNIDEELDEDGRICSELSSLKIQITKEEMKENNVGMFEHDADATEVETISTSNKLLHSESENEGKIDLKINSDQDYVADSDKSKPSETIISNSNKSYSKSEEKDKIELQKKNYEDFVGDSAKTNLTISSGIIISNSKSLYSKSEEEDKIELKTKNDEDNVEDSAKTIPTNPSEIINSNSKKSLHSKSEVENEIELKRKSAEDLSKEKYELILTEPLEKYQLTQLNIFDEDKSVIAEDIGKDLISTVNHEFSDLKRIDINTDSETSENKNATQNINDELSSTKSKNEIVEKIITDSATNLFDNEQNQDAIIIKSFEKEETYQDVPSIENNTEQYISEIKTDDTTNKDISEIEDLSELNYSSQDNGLKNKVEEFSEKSIEYTDNRNLGNNFEQKESIQENDVDENSFQSSQLFREGGSENDNSLAKGVENLIISNKKETEIIEDVNDLKSERGITEIQEEEKLSEQYDIDSASKTVEKSAKDNSSSSSYSDDFDEDKEDSSSTQEHLHISQKSILDSTLKIEEDGKVSDESEASLLERDSNNISDHDEKSKIDEIHQEEDKLKSTVQQRVSEILANTVGLQKSPRDKKTNCQDYYVTTYEDISPANSPESVSPVKSTQSVSINTFNNEAEELLKKQLAIELEIKHLEQQQKEQLPFVYMREIPNKPPPPYTPPSTPPNALGIVPARADDLKEICRYSAGVLYKAYTSNNLHAVTFNEKHFKTINNTKSTKECWSFVFDLCKEIAEDHYERFQTKMAPSWLKLPDKPCSKLGKNFTYHQLENYIHNKVRELLRFKKTDIKENSIKRWSKKKKDYVDEILIMESHEEEQEWLNYDNDELMVKNEITDAILDMLLTETIEVYKNIFS